VSKPLETLTIRATAETKRALEAIALEHGCTWGGRPNISALAKAIAEGEVITKKKKK
jgi:hypothetical protein